MRIHDLTDGQDIWDVVSGQTVNIEQLVDIVQKQSKELEVLTAAYIRQEGEIKQLKRMIYDLNNNGKIGLP